MSTTHNPKIKAAIVILKTRGYTELRQEQINDIKSLAEHDDISAIDIANEVVNAPSEITARAVSNVRSKTASLFQCLSDIIKPASEER